MKLNSMSLKSFLFDEWTCLKNNNQGEKKKTFDLLNLQFRVIYKKRKGESSQNHKKSPRGKDCTTEKGWAH